MTYHDYTTKQRAAGQWPLSKERVYNDARMQAIKDAAKAIGMTDTALIALIGDNQCQSNNK